MRFGKGGTDQAPSDVELGERVTGHLADLGDQAGRYADVGESVVALEAAVPHYQVERRGRHDRPPPSCGYANGQPALAAYAQKPLSHCDAAGPSAATWVSMMATVPLDGTMYAVVPVPPTQP